MAALKILNFYTQRGCEVCEMMRPIVDDFKRQHLFGLLVVNVDASRAIVSNVDIDPKTTPAFVLVDDGIPVKKHEGAVNLEELTAFVFGEFGTSIKRKRKWG